MITLVAWGWGGVLIIIGFEGAVEWSSKKGRVMITLVSVGWSGVLLIIGLEGVVEWSGKKGGVGE